MARTPIIYRHDDLGAPDLNAIMPTDNDKKNLMVHTILKACLVDGYGSKVAAGWTMDHEEITASGCRFSLKNTAQSGVLLYEGGVFSGGSTNLNADTLWSCIEVPELDSPICAWSGAVEYADRNLGGDSFHKTGLRYKHQVDAWVVIANENTCVFITGRESFDFSTLNASGGSWYSTKLIFGAMHDGFGGVADPRIGNFYVGYGSKKGYSSDSYNANVHGTNFTSCQDVVGNSKSGVHSYSYKSVAQESTSALINAWLPIPVVYFQYGKSGIDGDSSNYKYLSAGIPALRKLIFSPANYSALNELMIDRSWSYGQKFSFAGSDWLVFKAYTQVVDVFSLDAAEWGA